MSIALVLAPGRADAQSTSDDLDKYHALRKRLLEEFTVVGTNAGQSQPADLRNDTQGYIKWADSTIRLGWYLGVLASEHYLYAHPELFPGAHASGPETTDTELYDALAAMERLDLVADAAFPSPCTQTPALNGFFIRDDVPDGFHQNFPPLTSTQSDFIDPAITNKEMSQDQVYHVLLGLALVKVLVPSSVSVNGKALASWAVEQAKRIMVHVSDHAWVIQNPACGDRDVARGPLASGFSGGSRQAIGFITDGAFVPDTQPKLIDIWDAARDPAFAVYIDIDSVHMALAIAAVGDGWGPTTAEDIQNLSAKPDWPLYPLLHRVLHGDAAVGWCKTAATVNARARVMLDELPKGAEPASPQPNGPAVHGFTRSNRFLRGKETAYTGEPGSDGQRYNGLDYMLLHNLYAIATPATWESGTGPGVPECPAADAGTSDGGKAAAPSEGGGCGCRAAPSRTPGSVAWLVALLALRSWRSRARGSRLLSRERAPRAPRRGPGAR